MKYVSKLSGDHKVHSYIRIEKEDENYYYGLVLAFFKGKLKQIVFNGNIEKHNCYILTKEEFDYLLEISIFDLEKHLEK
ncbi:MAG: hypothetical protein KBA33_08310 [Cloacibacterium sp.]|nr:hypothetical protein [Cloacibacterium sp.]